MSYQNPSDPKRFSLTAFAAFASVFTFIMMMMNCKGNFVEGNMSVHTESECTSMENHQGNTEAIAAYHEKVTHSQESEKEK